MKKIKKIFYLFFFILFFSNKFNADIPYYLDFKYILNESDAGKKAQKFLKKKLENGIKNLKKKKKKIQEEEKKINSTKKINFTRRI